MRITCPSNACSAALAGAATVTTTVIATIFAMACASPCRAADAFVPEGTKALVAVMADGQRVAIGTLQFTPAAHGRTSFTLAMTPAAFADHFLSMREFKCIAGKTELSCHVPYPYANPRTVSAGDYAWLEHSLLFFYKTPSEFGAKLWNGVYYEFHVDGAALVGTPQAVDLNAIGAPPADPSQPPYRRALRDDMPREARWIRSLRIE